MSNIYSTPEQRLPNPENGRPQLVGKSRYRMQKGLLGLYPEIAMDLARQRRVVDLQLVERSTTTPSETVIETNPAVHNFEPTIIETTPPTSQEAAAHQQRLQSIHDQIDEAYAA